MRGGRPTPSHLVRQLLFAEARTWRLPGTSLLVSRLYPFWGRTRDYYTGIVPFVGGIIQVDTREYIEWAIYVYGGWDLGAISLLQYLLHPGGVVCDIGANVGAYTLPLARAVGPRGAVHAFEPQPAIRQRLQQNAALNHLRQITVSPLALGAALAHLPLYSGPPGHAGNTSLVSERGGSATEVCQVDTLDHYVEQAGLTRLDLLKIDVEGAELAVLHGAQETLRRWRPAIYIEVNPSNEVSARLAPAALSGQGASALEIFQFLQECGYRMWRNGADETKRAWQLQTVDDAAARNVARYENWLAVYPGVTPGLKASIQPDPPS